MTQYHIQTCSWNDMDDLQSLSANALRNCPITNTLLTDPARTRSNTVHTRHALAHFIYSQALQAQDAVASTSKVLKAINTRTPTLDIQACAYLRWYGPAPEDSALRKHEPEEGIEMPDFMNRHAWMYVENVRHTHRKALTNGKGHYFIAALHFEPNIEGWNGARELLSRIHCMDAQYPVVVLTKFEHRFLFRELGWEDAGSVFFEGVEPLAARGDHCLQAYVRRGG